jgi:predicted dehydrogenase
LAGHKGVELACVCDPDDSRAAKAAKAIGGTTGKPPKTVRDMRNILDDPSVDAVIVATPDHWHGPATLLACEAGKHVYVEKPCAHNIREGRLMIEAARRTNRVIQVGTQSRSTEHVKKAMQLLHDGAIGDVLVAKAWNSQRRRDIGHAKPATPPDGFDYDLWLGPAPYMPFQPNRFHYTWHWWYALGTGDMGNDGVHDIDLARWGLGVETHPTTVAAAGGKYFFDDDQQFPDTQTVLFEYPGNGNAGQRRQLIFEQRIWSPYRQEGFENGNAFYGTEGMLLLGKNEGWQLFGPRNKLIESMKPTDRDGPHQLNFLECIKSGQRPQADVEIGHLTATLCHLGNIATRVGRMLRFDPQHERIIGDQEADRLVRRTYRQGHWAVPQNV